jgi:hypothetical protein
MRYQLTIDLDIDVFADETPEQVEDALGRTSTHNPMDEVEGSLWAELHDRGIDSMVTVDRWQVR